MSPVNLDRIQSWLDQGRLNPKKPITMKELNKSRCIHGVKRHGVKLLGRVRCTLHFASSPSISPRLPVQLGLHHTLRLKTAKGRDLDCLCWKRGRPGLYEQHKAHTRRLASSGILQSAALAFPPRPTPTPNPADEKLQDTSQLLTPIPLTSPLSSPSLNR